MGANGDIRVITFNTAVGNPNVKTLQHDFLNVSIYREIIDGDPRAAILAAQEVGPQQADALKRVAAAGTFRVAHIKRPGQGNALLVPARYHVMRQRSRYFIGSQLRALVPAVAGAVTGRRAFNYRQFFELRMWTEARLRDGASGRELTVFNTHLSGEGDLRVAQARSLLRRVRRASARGPVILAGDLNTRAAD